MVDGGSGVQIRHECGLESASELDRYLMPLGVLLMFVGMLLEMGLEMYIRDSETFEMVHSSRRTGTFLRQAGFKALKSFRSPPEVVDVGNWVGDPDNASHRGWDAQLPRCKVLPSLGELDKINEKQVDGTSKITIFCTGSDDGKLNDRSPGNLEVTKMLLGPAADIVGHSPKGGFGRRVLPMVRCGWSPNPAEPREAEVWFAGKLMEDGVLQKLGCAAQSKIAPCAVNVLMLWHMHVVAGGHDMIRVTEMNMGRLANLVVENGAAIDSSQALFFLVGKNEKSEMSVGILQYLDTNNLLFEIHPKVWKKSAWILIAEIDINRITGTSATRKFIPQWSKLETI